VFSSLVGRAFSRSASTTVLVLAVLGAGTSGAAALPLTPFRYEAQAQRHCPGDKVVWLDFRKGVYYAKGQKRYGQGFDGSFVCLNEVRGSSYRRSLLGLR
jgi:hypothetical protein